MKRMGGWPLLRLKVDRNLRAVTPQWIFSVACVPPMGLIAALGTVPVWAVWEQRCFESLLGPCLRGNKNVAHGKSKV